MNYLHTHTNSLSYISDSQSELDLVWRIHYNVHIKVKHFHYFIKVIRIILVYVCFYLETGFLIGLASNKLKQDVN